jgi:hypothetical protein
LYASMQDAINAKEKLIQEVQKWYLSTKALMKRETE